MSFNSKEKSTIESDAISTIPGFRDGYAKFKERTTIDQCSQGMITGYGRSIASVALHFGRVPHDVGVEEINGYLYRIATHDGMSVSYFKLAVYGLRYWFRLFGMEEKAIAMPSIKRELKLPVVLSKQECKELFKAPRSLKHRYLLAFAYAGGLRMNELRLLKISDVDVHRKQVHIQLGKGRKGRYVTLSNFLIEKFEHYLSEVKPQKYLFEGQTPGEPMGERSIQYVIKEALMKTTIRKNVSMHTLGHSFATHLLEDGIDIHSIQLLLGHSHINTTIIYLHVAQVKTRLAHSPLDSLYGKQLG
jgi:site-specific recombinase XerD